ncbi:AAA family ATPase [Streptomyces sp. NPDC058441]|uniref:AAA family ATPase n=1 Tax=Streptomyces sp. NPDC058441 TaxID=3346502 RepID=UPI0036661B05
MVNIRRRLPTIEHVGLQNFSIYRERPTLDVQIRRGVFCLAGANGLGKSSFLSAINFGLTGIVANPDRSAFASTRKFYTNNLEYSRHYFDGRIEELDRDTAEVSLQFTVGTQRYELTRNLFEPESLRFLRVTNDAGEITSSETDDDEARHEEYKRLLLEDCRLSSFDQFAFLQHFLLTFDERRHLLFWDEQVTTPLLYLAFGIHSEDAKRADELTHAVNRAESQRRNAQWQVTTARRRMKETGVTELDEAALESLAEKHQNLVDKVDAHAGELHRLQREAADARLDLADVSAEYQSLRNQYDTVFSQRLKGHSAPHLHPLIAEAVQSNRCTVCGTTDPEIGTRITAKLDSHCCPLCDSAIARETPTEESFESLKQVDSDLAVTREKLKSAQLRRDRLDKSVDEALKLHSSSTQELEDFETANEKALPTADGSLASLLDQRRLAEGERQRAMERRDEWRDKRDAARRELEPLQRALRSAYETAETEFVPTFRELARRFLGLDLDVFLDTADKTRFVLGLEVQGTRRRATTALSESQRFFIDIALRMALIQQMTEPGQPVTSFIDTPEGSLDIAYEARAGAMFGDFVLSGKSMIMTANINANQLLLRLAEVCGSEHMELVRMTDWSALSEVQASEEALFDEAYSRVERILSGSAEQQGTVQR